MGEFRYSGLWQWNPVSCVTPRGYDERWMMTHSDGFFDRALMGRYFDAMRQAGLNTWILANTHPFPFMVNLRAFPEAVVLAPAELQRYQAHYHWLFETARARGIQPFVLFHTCYVPDSFGRKHGIRPGHSFQPPPLAADYTRHCVRQLCDTYPELAGINAEASENVALERRSIFAREAIVAGIHQSARRPVLFFRGWTSDPAGMKENVQDVYEGECFFTVKYTWEFLVHRKPDPEFLRWVKVCGAERVLGEFWISNYQPFGCHDLALARGIREELNSLGCPGFTSHPMDLYGAPFVQGRDRHVLQIERDLDWYATLSGRWSEGDRERAAWFGLPALGLSGPARCACAPSARISCFLTGNKQNFLQPQWLAAVGGSPERRAGVHALACWRRLPQATDASYGRWMPQIEGRAMRFPGEPGAGFRLEELIEELDRLDAQWADPPPGAPVHAEAYAAWRLDVLALRCMARAWIEHARGILAQFAERRAEAAAAFQRGLEQVRKMPELLGFDGPYRLLVGRHTLIVRWSDLRRALEEELRDAASGRAAESYPFGTAEHYDQYGRDFAERGK